MLDDDAPDPSAPEGLSRRRVLRGGVGLGLAATAVVSGAAAASVSYADTGAARHRAFAAKHEDVMPTSTRLLWRALTDEPVLALTFDDGPGPRFTAPLLDALEAEDVRATFFLVGERARQHPDLVRRQVAAGHQLGNHSWNHSDLSMMSREQVRRQLRRTNDALAELGGQVPTVLRPPWGRISGTVMHVAAEQHLDVAVWDVRLLERERDAPGNVRHVLDELRPGMVLLAHDAGPGPHEVGLAALPGIVQGARARGFRFVTVSEMLLLDRTFARR